MPARTFSSNVNAFPADCCKYVRYGLFRLVSPQIARILSASPTPYVSELTYGSRYETSLFSSNGDGSTESVHAVVSKSLPPHFTCPNPPPDPWNDASSAVSVTQSLMPNCSESTSPATFFATIFSTRLLDR